MMNILLILAFISVAAGIVAAVFITDYVSKRGVKINYFLWRIRIFKYVQDYKRLTLEETGKVGPWYYVLSVGFPLALIFSLTFLILKGIGHIQ